MIDLEKILNSNVNPPLSWACGIAMLITCFCIVTSASMKAKVSLGWTPASPISRFFMGLAAIVFLVNGIRILYAPSVGIMALMLSVSMCCWRVISLIDTIVDGWNKQGINIALAAVSKVNSPPYELGR